MYKQSIRLDECENLEDYLKKCEFQRELRQTCLGYIWRDPEWKAEFYFNFKEEDGYFALYTYDVQEGEENLYSFSKNPYDIVEDFLKHISYYEVKPKNCAVGNNFRINWECAIFNKITRSELQKIRKKYMEERLLPLYKNL